MREVLKRYNEFVLCKLTREDVAATRALYEETFREDSKAFVDYYYERKAPFNITFVLETRAGEIISMLHLTPYTLCVREESGFLKMPAYYVVAVATQEKYRRQGCMAKLLAAAGQHCMDEQVPYLFLMPAASAIYEPFGFQYCYARPEFYVNYSVKELPRNVEVFDVCLLREGGKRYAEYRDGCDNKDRCDILDALTQFTDTWLRTNTDFFLERSRQYYVNLMAELQAQNGSMHIFLLEGRVAGYYCRTGEGEPNMGCGKDCIQEAMLSDDIITAFLQDNGEPPILVSDDTMPVIMGQAIRSVWNIFALKKDSLAVGLRQRGWITELV